jgi:hypothetical protein
MMSSTGGSGHSKYAGLLPVPVRSTTLENDRQPPLPNRASRDAARFLITFCIGAAATLAWLSYLDAAREMIANSYPQLGWMAPRRATSAQKAPDTIALAGPAAPQPDERQLDTMLGDLHVMRLSLDQITAGQELITRSIDEIATRIVAGQEQRTRRTDQTATSIAAGQEPTTPSANQTAATIATGQEQVTRNTDQTAISIDQAPSKASSIPVESRGDAASLQPKARLNIMPTEAKRPQTLSEKGKPISAASGHDASCFPSASAVLQNHPGGWPTWTLRAPGHEGTMCWYAAARPRTSERRSRASDHRMEMIPRDNAVETTEKGLLAPPAPHGRGGSWEGGLP